MTEHGYTGSMEVEAQLCLPTANLRLVHYRFNRPANGSLNGDGNFRVELCLTSRHRSTRGCFREQWSPHRFERIGELFVVHRNARLVARSDESAGISAIVCELNGDSVLEFFGSLRDPTDKLLVASLDVREARIHAPMLKLAEELKNPGFAHEFMADCITRQLTLELIRHGGVIDRIGADGLAAWQQRVIEERLNEIKSAPTLAELAALCKISVRQLTRGFRASKGCSLGGYVASRQMEQAKGLLASDRSVAMIAAMLGFATSSSFCFAFRRAAGMSPKQFRDTVLRG